MNTSELEALRRHVADLLDRYKRLLAEAADLLDRYCDPGDWPNREVAAWLANLPDADDLLERDLWDADHG